jgi:hypothetical protein
MQKVPSKLPGSVGNSVLGMLKGFGYLFLICFICGGIYNGYLSIDKAGLIPHSATVELHMKSDWLVGENRVCNCMQEPSPDKGFILSALFCPAEVSRDEGHNISIRFWGRVDRPDAEAENRLIHWECTRNSSGFVCKALD